jgi:hypothetical protein
MTPLPCCRAAPEAVDGLCGSANHSLAHGGAWGWHAPNCSELLPFLCKMQGAWLAQGCALGCDASSAAAGGARRQLCGRQASRLP